jgi:hypothetical protein
MPPQSRRIRLGAGFFLLLACALFPNVARAQAGLEVHANGADATFPGRIEFSLDASVPGPVASAELEYGVERVACTQTSSRIVPDVVEEEEPGRLSARWTWDLRRSGSVPPGARIWWRWHVTAESGASWSTPVDWLTFDDDRFPWQSATRGEITVHWYRGGEEFGQHMLQTAVDAQSRLTADPGAGLREPVHIYFYADTEALKGAVLFAQRWTGGMAFPDYYTILIAAGPDQRAYGETTVAHELMHLVVRQLAFNCAASVPRWLDEGLAVWAEGGMSAGQQEALDEAITGDELLSLRSLNASFSAHAGRARLAYAQSYSVVAYLLDEHGRERILDLLAAFHEGATYDGALQHVYGFDTDALDDLWRAEVGAPPRPRTAGARASPSPVPTLSLWTQPTLTPPPPTATPSPTASPAPTPTPRPSALVAQRGPTATATQRPSLRPTPIGGMDDPAPQDRGPWLVGGGIAALTVVLAAAVGAVWARRRRTTADDPMGGKDR